MNHFDAVDFSECYSEEVMLLLTLSVYIHVAKLIGMMKNSRLGMQFISQFRKRDFFPPGPAINM